MKLEGSDHAPVYTSFGEIPDVAEHSTPSLARRYLPIILGQHQTLRKKYLPCFWMLVSIKLSLYVLQSKFCSTLRKVLICLSSYVFLFSYLLIYILNTLVTQIFSSCEFVTKYEICIRHEISISI